MNAPRRAGDPLPERDPATLISTMSVELLPIDLIVQWRRCSMTADYLGSYFSYLFEDRANATHALSTGINEIIENVAKFSANKRELARIRVSHHGEHLRVSTWNRSSRAHAEALASRLDRMASEDPEELFLQQLEHTASQDRAASGLGLITIKKDYGALLGVEITPVEGRDDLCEVAFHLEIEASALEQA